MNIIYQRNLLTQNNANIDTLINALINALINSQVVARDIAHAQLLNRLESGQVLFLVLICWIQWGNMCVSVRILLSMSRFSIFFVTIFIFDEVVILKYGHI